MKEDSTTPGCARCRIRITDRLCRSQDGKHPANCPTDLQAELCGTVLTEYERSDVHRFARQASIQEGCGYGNRVETCIASPRNLYLSR